MAEFQWWLLLVGLVAGGAVIGLLSASFARTDVDLAADELEAEATFIATHLAVDRSTVATVLEAHREYLGLPAPEAILPAPEAIPPAGSAGDGHPDGEADEVGHRGGGGSDRDLAGS